MRDALGAVQSVLVLGGGSDIARSTVLKLIEGRCRTVVLAGRSPDAFDSVADELRTAGATTVDTVKFDGLDTATHQGIIDGVFEAHGDIDLVLVAFGQLGNQDVFDDDPHAAAELARVNVAAPISAITASAMAMRRQGHGTIVVMSSVAGERVRKDNAVYGATKAGVDGFAQGLGDRLAGTGVRVMIVRPGFVHTKMTQGMAAAPFSTTPEKVADDIVAGLAKSSRIVWSPGVLRWVFTVMRHLPYPAWKIVSNR